MRTLTLTIMINKPVEEVFAFTIDPKNTSEWIDAITAEQTNEWPPKIGTIYRNQNTAGSWSEYTVTAFEPNKTFTLRKNNGYQVRYTFTPQDNNTVTKLEYEWIDNGELAELFLSEILEKLKRAMEQND